MSTPVLTLAALVVIWAAVLLPPMIRSKIRSGGSEFDSLQSVGTNGGMDQPGPTSAVPSAIGGHVPPEIAFLQHRNAMIERRRRILLALVIAVPLTLVGAIFGGTWLIALHFAMDLALGAYVALLLRAKQIAAEQEMKVAFLPHADVGSEPTEMLETIAALG